jgi:hypothetical protein
MGIETQMKSAQKTDRRFLTLATAEAPSLVAGPVTVTPVSRTLVLRLGGGVLTRSWPAAVLVARESRTSRVPIVNVTRVALVSIVAVAALCSWGLAAQASKRKGRSS